MLVGGGLSSSTLSSGNSAVQAISLLLRKGVPESNIIFLNLISVSQFHCEMLLFYPLLV